MPTVKRFEELEIWITAKELTVEIYKITKNPGFDSDWGLRDQLRRASVSIMANIAEGFDRNTKKEFINFLHYSLGSTSEVRSHLYLALEIQYISNEQAKSLQNKSIELTKRIKSFINYLRSDMKVNK